MGFRATVTCRADLIPVLPAYFGTHIRESIAQAPPPDAAGRLTLELRFESHWQARDRLLALGGAVEVLAPDALRASVLDFAQQIVVRYAASEPRRIPIGNIRELLQTRRSLLRRRFTLCYNRPRPAPP